MTQGKDGTSLPRRQNRSVAIALEQVTVGIDAAVAEEWPDPAHVFAALHIDFSHQDFGFRDTRFGEEFALRSEHVAGTPEVDPGGADR